MKSADRERSEEFRQKGQAVVQPTNGVKASPFVQPFLGFYKQAAERRGRPLGHLNLPFRNVFCLHIENHPPRQEGLSPLRKITTVSSMQTQETTQSHLIFLWVEHHPKKLGASRERLAPFTKVLLSREAFTVPRREELYPV